MGDETRTQLTKLVQVIGVVFGEEAGGEDEGLINERSVGPRRRQ
jgi:hypothetical protein